MDGLKEPQSKDLHIPQVQIIIIPRLEWRDTRGKSLFKNHNSPSGYLSSCLFFPLLTTEFIAAKHLSFKEKLNTSPIFTSLSSLNVTLGKSNDWNIKTAQVNNTRNLVDSAWDRVIGEPLWMRHWTSGLHRSWS